MKLVLSLQGVLLTVWFYILLLSVITLVYLGEWETEKEEDGEAETENAIGMHFYEDW